MQSSTYQGFRGHALRAALELLDAFGRDVLSMPDNIVRFIGLLEAAVAYAVDKLEQMLIEFFRLFNLKQVAGLLHDDLA